MINAVIVNILRTYEKRQAEAPSIKHMLQSPARTSTEKPELTQTTKPPPEPDRFFISSGGVEFNVFGGES